MGLRRGIAGGHRSQLLVAPTGAGKTVVASYLMHGAHEKRTQTAFVVDRVVLVEQTSRTLDAHGIPHGVVQSGHWRYRPSEPIQICSAQTIEKRGFFPGCKFLIVDEAHAVRKTTAELIQSVGDLRVVGLTATPFTKGLKDLYSNIVNVATTDELTEAGYLVPMKVYAAKAIDMAGAKVVAGEWSDKEVETRGLQIVGDIVAEWIDKTNLHFSGPVKTIVFSATVEHGAELCRQFQDAGFNFQQISYKDDNDDRRKELIEEFSRADSSIVGLVSCEALAKGFDVPDVLCGIGARPYRKSLSSHIQQIGRVLRPATGKEFALWLCHAGNYMRFLSDMTTVFRDGVQSLQQESLDAKPRAEPSEKTIADFKCLCGFVMPPRADRCPACGKERIRRSMVETVAGTMILVNGKPTEATGKHAWMANREAVWRQLAAMAVDKKGGDIAAAQRWAQAKFNSFYGEFARRRIETTEAMSPCSELLSRIRADNIRFVKGRQRSEQGVAA